MTLTNFYEKVTKKFDVTITLNNSAVDISSDAVTMILKKNGCDSDANAVMTSTADVATSGSSGVAKFTLSTSDTNLPPKKYYYDIRWTRSNGEVYILESGSVEVLRRVYD